MKIKRKPRNKMSKEVNLLYPVNLEDFGTDKDPCFGKHNDPKAPECQRCGDCEICAVVQSQNMHIKRGEVEKGQKFKDINNEIKHTALDLKDIKRFIRNYLKTLKGQYVLIDTLTNEVVINYSIKKAKAIKIVTDLGEKSEHIKFTKNKLKLKWDD